MPTKRKNSVNERYVIIGLGQIGCSLAAALRANHSAVYIHGVDLCWKNYYRPLLDSFSAKIGADLPGNALIIVATPLKAVLTICRQLFSRPYSEHLVITTGTLLSPFFNSDFEPGAKWRQAFVAGHPFAGTTFSGRNAVQAGLFAQRLFFYSHFDELSSENRRRFLAFLKKISARPRPIDPEEHDRIMAAVSNFPAILAYLLFAQVTNRSRLKREFLGSGFFKTSSLVLTPPEMLADIVSLNWRNIETEIDGFICQLKLFLKNGIGCGDQLQKINNRAELLRRSYEHFFQRPKT